MKVLATDFIMIPVSDMAQSLPFYQDILGLAVTANIEDQWVEFSAPPTTLALNETKDRGRSSGWPLKMSKLRLKNCAKPISPL